MNSYGFDQGDILKLQLAVEEACTNIAIYAYPDSGRLGEIRVCISVSGEGADVVIEDDGSPFDPTAKKVTLSAADLEDRAIGGLGIHLIRTLADSVSYERLEGQNILRMYKKRRSR